MKPGNLQIDVQGDHIVVTLAGTSYRALFYLSKKEAASSKPSKWR